MTSMMVTSRREYVPSSPPSTKLNIIVNVSASSTSLSSKIGTEKVATCSPCGIVRSLSTLPMSNSEADPSVAVLIPA